MYFIHSILTNMFRPVFLPSSGWCSYYKNTNLIVTASYWIWSENLAKLGGENIVNKIYRKYLSAFIFLFSDTFWIWVMHRRWNVLKQCVCVWFWVLRSTRKVCHLSDLMSFPFLLSTCCQSLVLVDTSMRKGCILTTEALRKVCDATDLTFSNCSGNHHTTSSVCVWRKRSNIL